MVPPRVHVPLFAHCWLRRRWAEYATHCSIRRPGALPAQRGSLCGGPLARGDFNVADLGPSERCTVRRPAHLDRSEREGETARRRKLEATSAAAETSAFEVVSIVVRQRLPDQLAAGKNIKTDRRFGIVCILRPAGNAAWTDKVDKAPQ